MLRRLVTTTFALVTVLACESALAQSPETVLARERDIPQEIAGPLRKALNNELLDTPFVRVVEVLAR